MLQRPELLSWETLCGCWSRSQSFDHVAAVFWLCVGGMVRRKEVRTELREDAHASNEHPHYNVRLQRDRNKGNRSKQTGSYQVRWLQGSGGVHLIRHEFTTVVAGGMLKGVGFSRSPVG
jgi:hypothetical protein